MLTRRGLPTQIIWLVIDRLWRACFSGKKDEDAEGRSGYDNEEEGVAMGAVGSDSSGGVKYRHVAQTDQGEDGK
jgi:hypothetical protein